jgi:hypothetical protein
MRQKRLSGEDSRSKKGLFHGVVDAEFELNSIFVVA